MAAKKVKAVAKKLRPEITNRDEHGLKEGMDYVFDEENLVDWRKMISKEHLVPNRQKTKETDVDKLDDKQLLILLAGIKKLASLRGYESVSYDVSESGQGVVAVCQIRFIPNFETEGRAVTFSAIADATPSNTTNFGKIFLAAVAENRAFVRCVRNFLRINIVGSDEMSASNETYDTAETNIVQGIDPYEKLQSIMMSKGISWDVLKQRLIDENFDDAAKMAALTEVPKKKVFELIERINKIN